MDDFMGKIQEILSDEESMKQIQELAQMLNIAPEDGQNQADGDISQQNQTDSGGLPNFDIGMIFKIQELMQMANSNDKNADLLLALKPHMSEEKQAKIDKAVKIFKLLTIYSLIKESGMLNDLQNLI